MNGYTHNTACRICLGTDLVKVLDLGATPPANAYLRKEDLDKPEASFPLALYFCRTCSLAQLLDVVDPSLLFKDYHFLTSASKPSVDHFRAYADTVIRPHIDSPEDLVVDIGGNDGTLLSFLKDEARVLNVDPADNLAPLSEEKGVPFHTAFFAEETADNILAAHGPARVVTANNVFAHTDALRSAFRGVAKLIGNDGIFVFEVHWVKHLVDENAFDQIYHEHLCFYSLHAAKYLIEASGMHIFDVEIISEQGKSLRVYAAKNRPASPRVTEILAEEASAGLIREEAFLRFADRVKKNKENLLALLKKLKAEGKRITGYGAPAKGNTLLNYYGIGPETLDYLTDSTPLKQSLYSPGMHIPIKAPEALASDPPDYILLLAWNFKDFILAKEQALRDGGAKFILTIPSVEVV